ncbi:MAG: GIY-YIG nuclease family protein [Cyanobacteria bacterium P01_F01_bin.150]
MTTLSTEPHAPSLADLDFSPYVDEDGCLPKHYSKVVGIYAIFDQTKCLQFVGYSRDVTMSLKQHLVRCPELCGWIKVQTIERPKRAILEAIETAWIEENGNRPPGNDTDTERWTQPINIKRQMTPDEQALYTAATSDVGQTKILKKVALRVESDIKATLKDRGVKESFQFDPKLKAQGLLNIRPVK